MISTFFFSFFVLGGCHRAQVLPTVPTTGSAAPNFEQARLVVHSAAGDLDISTRTMALSILIGLEPGGGDWAERALWDPSVWVRRAAIDALAQRLPEPQSRVALVEFVEREGMDHYSRCAAAVNLARAGDFATLSRVQQAYQDAAEPWLAAPCALAAAQMGDAVAIDVLSGVLVEGELPLELGFGSDIGASELEELIPHMLVAIEMVEPSMEIALAAALVQLDDKRGRVRLERLLGSASEELQLEVIETIAVIPSETVSTMLSKVARSGSATLARAAMLALISRGEMEPTSAVALLVEIDREVRAQAVRALGGWVQQPEARGGRRAARLAQQGIMISLGDEEDMVLLAGVRAVQALGNPSDVALLAPLVEADSSRVQLAAAGAMLALEEIGQSAGSE